MREVGRSSGSVAFSHRCSAVLSESLRRPVRGVSVVFAEECRSSFSSQKCARLLDRVSHSYLVDPASSHMLVSKTKPCMSKYERFVL